jgi:hypothetical protein
MEARIGEEGTYPVGIACRQYQLLGLHKIAAGVLTLCREGISCLAPWAIVLLRRKLASIYGQAKNG